MHPNKDQASQFSETAKRRVSESLPSGTLSEASAAENQEGSVVVTPVKNLSSLLSGRQVIRLGRSPTTFTKGEGASASDPLVWNEEPDPRDPLLAPQLTDPGGSGESILAIPSRYSTDQGRRDSGLSTSFSIYREATKFGVSDSEESVSSLEAVEEEYFEDIAAGNSCEEEGSAEENQQLVGALTGVGGNGEEGPSRPPSRESSRASESSQSSEDSKSEDQASSNSSFSSSDEEMAAVGGKYASFLGETGSRC